MTVITRRALLAAGAVVWLGPQARAQLRRVTIGTNPAGTAFFLVGGGIAKMLSDKAGIQAIAQPYAGSSVYLPLIQAGEVTMGISTNLDSGGAYRGEQGRQAMRGLRALCRLWPLPYGYVVRGDSAIRSMADLKGRRVVVDIAANASLGGANKALLAVGALKEGDFSAVAVGGLPQGIKAITDGAIDAMPVAVGMPLVREANAAIPGGLRFLPIDGPNGTDEFLDRQLDGFASIAMTPSPAAPEIREPIRIGALDVYMIVGDAMREADATRLVELIHDSWEGLQQDYASLRTSTRGDLSRSTNTVPYHPAAAAFFRAKGQWTAANEARERRIGTS